MRIGSKVFENYTYVMAIINLTPDSFYAPSRRTADDVLFAAERAQKEGAAILDLGAQSTRPGYTEVGADEEISRFSDVVEKIKSRLDIPVSIDTYFSKTAKVELAAGADMINDIWGLSRGDDMAEVIAKSGASVCIMHNSLTESSDLWGDIFKFLTTQTGRARAAGIPEDKICVDGGIGFAKSREQNFELLNGYEKLSALGYPTLLGCSRKSMFGGMAEDRLEATLESTRLACRKGVLFVRVHDVAQNALAIKKYYDGKGA